tara:strand:+ start:1032 stop:1211 length:180 start_codon:yes stop_codon:yes gene_type:complete
MSSNRVEVLLRLKPHSVKDLIEKGIPLPRMYFADLIVKGKKIKSAKIHGTRYYYIKEKI